MKEKKLFVFDLDGTLMDNTHLGFDKINRNLAGLGLPGVSEDFLRRAWGKKAEDLFNHVCWEVRATAEQTALFKERDRTLSLEVDYQLSAALMDAVHDLRRAGCYIGIITSRTSISLQNIANQTGLILTDFHYVQSATHFYHHKPDGRVFGPIINWATTKGLRPEQIVYFGDTVDYDYRATLDSNPPLDFVGVASGVNTPEEFRSAGLPKSRIIHSFADFPAYLQKFVPTKTTAVVSRLN